MKTLLTFFILLFSSSVVADDISDFEIEGISIGDSLLDYFSEEEINDGMDFIYEVLNNSQSKNFAAINYDKNLSLYEIVTIDFKTNDPKFEIASISGMILYENSIDNCFKKQKIIFEEVKLLLTDVPFKKFEPYSHEGYPEGDVILNTFSFFLDINKRSNFEIICWEISEKINLTNRLDVSLKSHEFNDFMEEIYLN